MPASKKHRDRTNLIIALVVLLLLAGAFLFVPGLNLDIFGGFQGQATAVNSFSFPNSGLIAPGGSFPSSFSSSSTCGNYLTGSIGTFGLGGLAYSCQWSWASSSITSPELNVQLSGALGQTATMDVSDSIGNVVALCSAGNYVSSSGSPCGSVSLYTNQKGNSIHQFGYIVPYVTTSDISVGQSTSGNIAISGVSIINELGTFFWNGAYADPTNSSWQGNIVQVPLYAIISGCQVSSTSNGGAGINLQDCSASGGPNNFQINPMYVGSQVSLYTNPQITGSWNSLGCSLLGLSPSQWDSKCQQAVQQTLQSTGLPSSTFNTGTSYFQLTLQNVGSYGCGFGGFSVCWPAGKITITVYTLLIGTFIKGSTNPNTTTQEAPPGGNPGCSTSQTSSFGVCVDWGGLFFDIVVVLVLIVIAIVLVAIMPTLILRRFKK